MIAAIELSGRVRELDDDRVLRRSRLAGSLES